jgi:hypothetical protein
MRQQHTHTASNRNVQIRQLPPQENPILLQNNANPEESTGKLDFTTGLHHHPRHRNIISKKNTLNDYEYRCRNNLQSHNDLLKFVSSDINTPTKKDVSKYKSTIIQETNSPAKKKWRKINNIYRAIIGMKTPLTKKISTKV